MERAQEMISINFGELPALAVLYAKYNCNLYGMCGETLLTSWAHYAQAVENLPCDNSLYAIDDNGRNWFKENAGTYSGTWKEFLEKGK